MSWFYREVRWGYFSIRDVEEPLYDVKVTKDGVIVTVDLPGATRENLRISASEDAIMVEATSKVGGREIRYRRLISMPITIDPERVTAKLSNGILQIVAPPKEAGFRRIKVE